MSATFFISDLHLSESRPETRRLFFAFLKDITGCDALYILGDLFDTWVGDDDDRPLARETQAALASLTTAGHPVYLMHGNRDFLIGDVFCGESGVQLLPDPTEIDLYGIRTLLLHGDTLCTDDDDYLAFRARVRNPQWQREVLQRSLTERRELAHQLRIASGEATSNKAHDIVDANPKEVERVMLAAGVTQLIHGHTHRPAQHIHTTGTRWVLGDWDTRPTLLKVDSKNTELTDI